MAWLNTTKFLITGHVLNRYKERINKFITKEQIEFQVKYSVPANKEFIDKYLYGKDKGLAYTFLKDLVFIIKPEPKTEKTFVVLTVLKFDEIKSRYVKPIVIKSSKLDNIVCPYCGTSDVLNTLTDGFCLRCEEKFWVKIRNIRYDTEKRAKIGELHKVEY